MKIMKIYLKNLREAADRFKQNPDDLEKTVYWRIF